VIAQLWRSTGGSWPALIAALYAGALPAVPLSVLVGAVHYVSFCTTRRALASVTKADGEARSSSSSSSSSSSQQHGDTSQPLLEQQQHAHAHQHVIVTHGVTGTHFMPMEDPAAAADEQPDDTSLQDSSSKSCKSSSSTHHTAAAKGSTPAAAAAAESDEAEERPISHDVGRGSMALNMACAVITAVITAVVEAPLEQFRHNSQAGNINGNFVREMWRVRAAITCATVQLLE
jgi:hypothetical protein